MSDADLIDFLIATPRQATATETARSQPAAADPRVAAAAHDVYTRLLHRLEPDAAAPWAEVEPDVRRKSGVPVVDDSVLDEPYVRAMDLVHRTSATCSKRPPPAGSPRNSCCSTRGTRAWRT